VGSGHLNALGDRPSKFGAAEGTEPSAADHAADRGAAEGAREDERAAGDRAVAPSRPSDGLRASRADETGAPARRGHEPSAAREPSGTQERAPAPPKKTSEPRKSSDSVSDPGLGDTPKKGSLSPVRDPGF